jgi:hypothetical protein
MRTALPTRCLLLLLALLMATAAHADHLLTIEVQRKIYDEDVALFSVKPDLGEENLVGLFSEETKIFIGEGRIRVERGDREIWILLEKEKKVFHVHPDQQHYEVFHVPLQLEQELNSQQKRQMAQEIAQRKPRFQMKRGDETKAFGPWRAQAVTFHIRQKSANPQVGTIERTIQSWMTTHLGIDLQPYKSLIRFRGALRPWNQAWADSVADLEGFPVFWQMNEQNDHLQLLETRQLLSVTEVTATEAMYTPPKDYRRIEKPFAQWPR